MDGQTVISIVVPVFNEAGNLLALYEAVAAQMDRLAADYEIVFVNDGSRDASMDVLRRLAVADARVKVVSLSRNFGHQYALSAGLEFARGEAVVVMDADLQHPPELLPEMIALWRQGVQVVYTIRDDAEESSAVKRWTSAAFYRLMAALSETPIVPGAADFRLMDRKVVDTLNAMPERSRFVRGMVSWLGFRQQGLHYRAQPRFSGKSKYSLRKMVNLAIEGVTSFSCVPLRVSAVLGLAAALCGLPYAVWAVYARLFTDVAVPGWASLLVAVLFLGGVQLMSIGVIGEYIGRIYVEVKRRPLYLAEELIGFDVAADAGEAVARRAPQYPSPHFASARARRAALPDR